MSKHQNRTISVWTSQFQLQLKFVTYLRRRVMRTDGRRSTFSPLCVRLLYFVESSHIEPLRARVVDTGGLFIIRSNRD